MSETKKNAVKRIGVLTSGGDAPGMNAAVRSVVRAAVYRGIEVVGIRRGWNGLINGDIVRLDERSVAHIIDRGGTILYTARSEEFRTEEGQKKAVSTCKLLGLDGIVAIGGDGTFRGALALSKYGISVVGLPGTIDNDIACTDYCIGFDTAANTAIECIDKLRDTMQSHERCSVVEVMGRNAGHLALYVGLAVGATAVLVPESKESFDTEIIEKIRNARLNGFTHYMVVVAEGAGSAFDVANRIRDEIALDPRVPSFTAFSRISMPSVYFIRAKSFSTTNLRRSINPLSTILLRNSISSAQFSNAQRTQYFMKSSARFMLSSISLKATSGSIIQNSDKWRGVFEFSARNVGPKVYIAPNAVAPSSPSSCPETVSEAGFP